MQTTETMTTDDRNWSSVIRAELEAAGLTLHNWPDRMNAEQGEAFLTDLKRQVLEHKAASA